MTGSQNNFNCAQKLSIMDMTRSVSCFVCIEKIVFMNCLHEIGAKCW